MASSSQNNGDGTLRELAQLKSLHHKGIISLQEFLRMSTDIAKTWDDHTSEVRDGDSDNNSKEASPESPGLASPLVDEGGDLFIESPSPVHSLPHHGGSPSSHASPAQCNTPQQYAYDPSSWKSGAKVTHNWFGKATFIRLGNSADFLNDGNARIVYQKLKKGCKSKLETLTAWVKPSTITISEQLQASDDEESPVRKSPRTESHAREQHEHEVGGSQQPASQEQLPKRAALERPRKLTEKEQAPVRGRQKMVATTAPSKISVEKRIKEFPYESFCPNAYKSNDWIRCACCKKDIFNKQSSLASHCKRETRPGVPSAHAKNLEQWNARTVDDSQLKIDLVNYFASHPDESAGTNDPDELLYRYRVTEAFLAVPPFERVDRLRTLLGRAPEQCSGKGKKQALLRGSQFRTNKGGFSG